MYFGFQMQALYNIVLVYAIFFLIYVIMLTSHYAMYFDKNNIQNKTRKHPYLLDI